jgi:hypothetical protein
VVDRTCKTLLNTLTVLLPAANTQVYGCQSAQSPSARLCC